MSLGVGSGSSAQSSPHSNDANAIKTPSPTTVSDMNLDYVVVILMENQNYTNIMGNHAAPYTNRLGSSFGLATNYFDASNNFSLPNYLAIISGSGYDSWSRCNRPPSQCSGFTPITGPTILDRLESAGLTWKAYMEAMPSDCYELDSGNYVVRHNPFAYLANIINNPSECTKVVPAGLKVSSLIGDLSSTSTASNFSWLTPDLCNDMHSCPVSTGDSYLSQVVPAIINSVVFRTQRAALFLTWDEGSPPGRWARIPMILAGPMIKQNYTSNLRYNHYSLLKTLEAIWDLPTLTSNDAAASPMTEFFNNPQPNINYTPRQPQTNQTITFQANANNGVSPYVSNWNFGDGETTNGTVPVHSYETAGSYKVTLTVTDELNHTATSSEMLNLLSSGPGPTPTTTQASSPNWLLGKAPLSIIATVAVITVFAGVSITKLRDRARRTRPALKED